MLPTIIIAASIFVITQSAEWSVLVVIPLLFGEPVCTETPVAPTPSAQPTINTCPKEQLPWSYLEYLKYIRLCGHLTLVGRLQE